jgi:hypothetical protein
VAAPEQRIGGDRQAKPAITATVAAGVDGTYSLNTRAVASLIGQAGVKSATGIDGDRLIAGQRIAP